MASLREVENEVAIEEQFIGNFGKESDNHYTWGKTQARPITAAKRRGIKGPRVSMNDMLGLPPGLFGFVDEGSPELIIPNSPDRSPLLPLPLEIREDLCEISHIQKTHHSSA
jgi:hypothetical protein